MWTMVGSADELPFGDNSFDVVTIRLALHHLLPAAQVACVREMVSFSKVFLI